MKKIVNTTKAPKAIGPYSQAVETNGMLFISGQIPINPETGKIVEGGITEQNLRKYAECGVDYISSGALTHSVANMDMSLKAINK